MLGIQSAWPLHEHLFLQSKMEKVDNEHLFQSANTNAVDPFFNQSISLAIRTDEVVMNIHGREASTGHSDQDDSDL